ncbi:MAG TPA: ABC transporter permease [Euryarchaeota archaeon]|nr:ABC transporter permease [Euryarchaeota archaeon]
MPRDRTEWMKLLRRLFFSASSIAIFLIIWHILAWLDNQSRPVVIVYPLDVFENLFNSFLEPDFRGFLIQEEIYSSLKRLFFGFVLALAIALPLGLLMGYSSIAMSSTKPIVEILRPIPPLAWVPVFLALFGNSFGPVMIVFIGIFFPVLLGVIFGVRNVPPELVDASKTLGARPMKIFSKVIFPSTVPYLMNGIYIGLGVGWMCIVAAEMLGVIGGGLGYRLIESATTGRYDSMYACIIMLGILGFLTTELARISSIKVREWMGMGQE